MSIQATAKNSRPVAKVVPDDDRLNFLPNLFGYRNYFAAESLLYTVMGSLSPKDYSGGYWDFYALDGKPLYMVPPAIDRYRISCDGNGYSGEVSSDAAGIIVTLFTLSHMSFARECDHLAEAFHRLYAYAAEHPEARAIFRAID